jgi:hypothetical protein
MNKSSNLMKMDEASLYFKHHTDAKLFIESSNVIKFSHQYLVYQRGLNFKGSFIKTLLEVYTIQHFD